ncbi:MAG: ABC transporter substrate-binding protein, partial [Candidatus Nanopelagicales bacterium]
AIGVAAGALILAACSGGSSDGGGSGGEGQAGGTLTILSPAEQILSLDPQVIYTGEDLAFAGATIMRSLTAYQVAPGDAEGTTLVPDMATDTGTASNEGKTWQFTLRDGMKWEDGSPVTCADVAYGVSRQFDIGLTEGGPVYAVSYLDIPTDDEGNSAYAGPADGTGQELFDAAVSCDGQTITFNLNQSVPDFNYAVTLGFSAVPAGMAAGVEYGDKPMSNGPYKISEYSKGKGGKLVLVRNENWSADVDPYRKAYPDSWVVNFGVEESVADQRVIQSSGEDEYAMVQGLTTASLPIVFEDPQYESRRIDAFDPYSIYAAVNAERIPDEKCRQAIGVALDRDALLLAAGGTYAGTYADGVVKPNIGIDYAPTELWDGLLGQPVAGTGDPEFAKKLLGEGANCPTEITLAYAQSDDNDKAAAIWVESLGKAGITVKPNPIERGQYYGVVFENGNDIMLGGWGPDWPNASTVIPPLFVQGWNLSRVDDPAYAEKVSAAMVELNRETQATMWHELSKEAAQKMWVVPTRFGRDQRLAGTKVGPIFSWSAYGSFPYPIMYAVQ